MEELDEFMAESNARARRGRRLARELLGAVLYVLFFAGFLSVLAPDSISGMGSGPGPFAFVVPGVGVLGLAAGLIWMVRILRADPEPDTSAWRYRDG